MATVVYTTASRDAIRQLIATLPAMMAGRVADSTGVVRAFKTLLGVAFLSTIKDAFITKARGGTDEAGLKWPPLTKEYLAYQRPHIGRQPPKAGGKAPGGADGFMTSAQLQQWRGIFASVLKREAARGSLAEAKGIAARTAWAVMKKHGVKTKLDAFGNRPVEILRDRGILLNSLSPGLVTGSGIDAGYSPSADQVFVANQPGELTVGSNVAYAAGHHGRDGKGRRPLWPPPESWPMHWWDDWLDTALVAFEGIGRALR